MSTILLSIKPEYANRIFAGTKKYEFRKRIAKQKVDKIIVYSSCPKQKVVGEVGVVETLSLPPAALWESTKEYAGISKSKFDAYFAGCDRAYAYKIGKISKYSNPKELNAFGIKYPPQSFVYIGN